MQIQIHAHNVESSAQLREHTLKGVRAQLNRFATRIVSVAVRIVDVNGPRGGADKRCQITVQLRTRNPITTDDLNTNVFAAVDRALTRAARAVGREVDRLRASRRFPALGARARARRSGPSKLRRARFDLAS